MCRLGVIPVLVAVLALAACSEDAAVAQPDLEERLTEQITPDDPEDEVSVECEGDLAGEVDAEVDCPTTIGEDPVTLRVLVTAVDGSDLEYELTPVIEADDVAATIEETLTGQDYPVESVTCEGELIGEIDVTQTCAVTNSSGDEIAVEATVTSVEGFLIGFDFAETS
ncbi:MAG: DUF4333 domain-containing protein [Nocardioides sp.]